ncbi:hypothetical protein RIF29_15364 [Crotalaria pallida]|uniref:Uncharacterized protein n=1 Tax=Crotalaria pallida TaxID=3830 RepID=A0AAN9FFH3_CROPI
MANHDRVITHKLFRSGSWMAMAYMMGTDSKKMFRTQKVIGDEDSWEWRNSEEGYAVKEDFSLMQNFNLQGIDETLKKVLTACPQSKVPCSGWRLLRNRIPRKGLIRNEAIFKGMPVSFIHTMDLIQLSSVSLNPYDFAFDELAFPSSSIVASVLVHALLELGSSFQKPFSLPSFNA